MSTSKGDSPNLPADVLVHVTEVEARANKAYCAACAERDALRERLAKLEAFVWQLSEHGCAEFDGQLQRARDFLVDQEIDLTPVLKFPK